MAYVDYTFYTSEFYGTAIDEADFPGLSLRASAYVGAVTMGRVDMESTDAKNAICAVAEIMQEQQRVMGSAYTGEAYVSSETVGSWTRNFKQSAFSMSDLEVFDKRRKEAVLLYLGSLLGSNLVGYQVRRCDFP